MILIISDQDDDTTTEVMFWLKYFDAQFIRIDGSEKIEIHSFIIVDGKREVILRINGDLINISSSMTKIWYRRGMLTIPHFFCKLDNTENADIINRNLHSESVAITHAIWTEIETKSLNSQRTNHLNKMDVLTQCGKLGINVPPTLITDNKSVLKSFMDSFGSMITKTCSQGLFLQFKTASFVSLTTLVDMDQIPSKFSPSLFQKTVEKAFEIRSFYLDGQFYSSAIFSQNDEKTQIDFRNYNAEKPNRTPPFKLPIEIETKLDQLMKYFNLKSGSIDLIVTQDGGFVFLEVNPIGQFKQVSYPCNYYLEKKVAQHLIAN